MTAMAATAFAVLSSSCTTGTATQSNTFQPDPESILFYDRPASAWEETLPLGNGRLGMMPDGGISRERIVLNEIYSGADAKPIIQILMQRKACTK